MIIFHSLLRSSIIVLVGFWFSNNDKTIIFKLFDFFSSKFSRFYLRIRIRSMILLRLLLRFFWSILWSVLPFFVTFFSFLIIATFIISPLVTILTIISVPTFSFIIIWSIMFLIRSLILDWITLNLIIVSFCFAENSILCWLNLWLGLFGFDNYWSNLDRLINCNWWNNRSQWGLYLYFSFRKSLCFYYFWLLWQDSIHYLLLVRNLRWNDIVSVFFNENIQSLL